jgi:hypothetical protein
VSTKVKSRLVVLEVIGEVRFFGQRLPVGRYVGREQQFGVPAMDGQIDWAAPEYVLELTVEQMRTANMPVAKNQMSIEEDLTPYVASGTIKVR